MPSSVAGSTLAVLFLAVLLVVVDYLDRAHPAGGAAMMAVFRRRRPKDGRAGGAHPDPDPGSEAPAPLAQEEVSQEEAVADQAAGEADPDAEIPASPRASTRPPGEFVDFRPPSKQDEPEQELRFRTRFRRGLSKTRDLLNRDVREVFGSGPIAQSFNALEEALVRADVGIATATALTDELRARGRELNSSNLAGALKDALRSQLGDAERRLRVNTSGLSVWLIVGVNGSGKTTSVAKLARLASGLGYSTCVAAADTFRAAAIEQLQTWVQRVDVDLVRQHQGADPAAVVYDAISHAKATGHDLVIADTAGRLHNRKPLMDELSKVRRVVDREPGALTECLLVLDAGTGQNGIAQARAFSEAVDVTGLILSKLDGTAKGGIVLAVERELGIPVKAVGVGEGADDLVPFDPPVFIDAVFGAGD